MSQTSFDPKREVVVKVRDVPGSMFIARCGKGKDAKTATCTSGADFAAIACAKKVLQFPAPVSRWLMAVPIPQQGTLPGLKVKQERGVTYWRVALSHVAGGAL